MRPSVTIAIPVYRRLEHLETALRSVDRQDHGEIDVLISDNGGNGAETLREMASGCLSRPFRVRSNGRSVSITEHYNQLVDAASGEYFMLLCDDDELGTEDTVTRLVAALEEDASVAVALPRLEVIDEVGSARPRNNGNPYPPRRMTGYELVRRWCRSEYNFVCFVTTLARTEEIRSVGRYPVFPKGTAVDNALLLRLVLGRQAAFVPEAIFRYRVYQRSHGLALSPRELATDLKAFLRFLDEDEALAARAAFDPAEWAEARASLVEMTWRTYLHRWRGMYRQRLTFRGWLQAGIHMPWILPYYRSVLGTTVKLAGRWAKRRWAERSETAGG